VRSMVFDFKGSLHQMPTAYRRVIALLAKISFDWHKFTLKIFDHQPGKAKTQVNN